MTTTYLDRYDAIRDAAVARGLPKLLFSVADVAAMLGRSEKTIRDLCFAGRIPYRLETAYWGQMRRTRRMIFTAREIQVAIDYLMPPVEAIQTSASGAARPGEVVEGGRRSWKAQRAARAGASSA